MRVWLLTTYLSCHHMCLQMWFLKGTNVVEIINHSSQERNHSFAHLLFFQLSFNRIFCSLFSCVFFFIFCHSKPGENQRKSYSLRWKNFLNYTKVFNGGFLSTLRGEMGTGRKESMELLITSRGMF